MQQLLEEFKKLECKIDDNIAVRKDILDKLNSLNIKMEVMHKDYYGNGKKGTHQMTHAHQDYFMKMSGAVAFLSVALAWMKVSK